MQKKPVSKPKVNTQAAKILEQYRNAGKAPGQPGGEGGPVAEDENINRHSAPLPPPTRRSGTRGK